MARVEFTIEAAGVREVVETVDAITDQKVNEIKRVVNNSAAKITRMAKQRAPVDTGRLRASIQMRPSRGGLEIEVGTNVEYAPYIEFGTRGGVDVPSKYEEFARQFKGNNGFPPPGVLLDWMRRHGIPESAEYAIRKKIFEKGTKAQPFLFNSFEEEVPNYLANLRKVLKG